MRLQERDNQHFLDVLGFVRRVAASDRPSDDALLRWRSQIDTALAGVLESRTDWTPVAEALQTNPVGEVTT